MELLIDVRRDGAELESVRVRVDPRTDVAELTAALAARVGATGPAWVTRTGAALARGAVGDADLRTGDTLHFGATPSPVPPVARFDLMVVGGRETGRRIRLTPGAFVVGRDTGCELPIDDPEASRRHLHLGVGSHEVIATDLGSTNGTLLDGAALTGPAVLHSGQLLRIGTTLLSIETAVGETGSALTVHDGWLDFDRPPRVREPAGEVRVTLPLVPTPVQKRRLPLSASLVPIAVGGVLAYFLGPTMLLFSMMGPVMAVASLWEDRRSGRKDFHRKVTEFDTRMRTVEPEASQRHDALVRARRAAAPSSAVLVRRAVEHTADLWQRRPGDPDFLTVRIGSADLPSRLAFDQPSNDQGDEAMAARVAEIRDAHTIDSCVPVDVDLQPIGVLGVAGPDAPRQAMLRSFITQFVTLASPRDLALVVLSPPEQASVWAFTRWLPHTTTLVSGNPDARTVAADEGDIRAVLQLVDDLITQRRIDAQRKLGFGDDGFRPHVVLVVPGSIPVPRATLSRIFATGPEFGVSVLVGAARAEHLPGECRAAVTVDELLASVSVVITGTGDRLADIVGDGLPASVADEAAHALAPVRDVTAASVTGEVPRTALLTEVLGSPELNAAAVARLWSTRDRGLSAPIGIGAAGIVRLDLRRDGPHGLVAGTTGAGKSELLQSLVTALAANHRADKLTFVLVDYKGGAAFADCVALPHTVGFFTDLDAHLARRALVSLNAELRRREETLREYGAKDIIDMEARFAAHAPANLLIVFDEFAFLKKEVPEFVAGVVDIAQRGRSLGVHLILATQRPSGIVDDHIRANTNLRIALRIADEADSSDVIDRPDAAYIPKSLPGRAYVRTGHSDVTVVQAAFGGARAAAGGPQRIETSVAPFRFTAGLSPGRGDSSTADSQPTDLQNLVQAIAQAHRDLGVPDQPAPWLAPLVGAYPLAGLVAELPSGRLTGVVGVVDLPSRQTQAVWAVDLDELGHLLVFGTGGSGKTTVLRTLAASLASRLPPADLHLYALDFGSRGLHGVGSLPQCGGVIDAEDHERTERLFAMLDETIAERKRTFGEVGAASMAEFRAAGHHSPYVVVLLDGYGAFNTTYLNVDHGELIERLARFAAEGRAVGVHFVITADRRSAVPSTLTGVMPGRIVLRMADPDEYAAMGMPMALADVVLPRGRGFVDGDVELQVAYVGPEPSGQGQRQGLESLAGSLAAGEGVPWVALLPELIRRSELPPARPGPLRPLLGVSGDTYAASYVDLEDVPTFTIFGPDRSGRSSALASLVTDLWTVAPDLESYLLTPRRSPLRALSTPAGGGWTRAASGVDACDELAVELGDLVRTRSGAGATPFLVVIDDADELVEGRGSLALETVTKRGRDAGLHLLVAVQAHTAHRTFGGWLTEARKAKHGLILAPDIDLDGDLLGTRLPRKSGRRFPVGRGYVVRRGAVEPVQVALP